MATDLRSLPAFLSDATTFRAWSQGVHAQLIACGMVQTSDTGQVDLSAAVLPSASAYAGYRIYTFNDSLQATKPVYLKLEYGVGSPADKPALRAFWGTGSNGAGTLTGTVGAATVIVAASSKTAGATLPSYCSGDGSRISLCSNLDSTSTSFRLFLACERSRDPDGAANGVGFWYLMAGAAVQHNQIPFTGSAPGGSTALDALPAVIPRSGTGQVASAGSEVALYPFFLVWGRPYPLVGIVGYLDSSIVELVPMLSDDWLGAPRTFLPLGDGGPVPTSGASIAILWE